MLNAKQDCSVWHDRTFFYDYDDRGNTRRNKRLRISEIDASFRRIDSSSAGDLSSCHGPHSTATKSEIKVARHVLALRHWSVVHTLLSTAGWGFASNSSSASSIHSQSCFSKESHVCARWFLLYRKKRSISRLPSLSKHCNSVLGTNCCVEIEFPMADMCGCGGFVGRGHDSLPSFFRIRGSFFVPTNCTREFVSVLVPVRTEFFPERERKRDSFSFSRDD